MNLNIEEKKSDLNLALYLKKSSVLHVLFVLSFFVVGFLLKMSSSHQRDNNLKLIERSIRVDMIAMPVSTMQEIKNINLHEIKEVS